MLSLKKETERMSTLRKPHLAPALALAALIAATVPCTAQAAPWFSGFAERGADHGAFAWLEKAASWFVDLWTPMDSENRGSQAIEKAWTIGGTGGAGSTGSGSGGGAGSTADPNGHF